MNPNIVPEVRKTWDRIKDAEFAMTVHANRGRADMELMWEQIRETHPELEASELRLNLESNELVVVGRRYGFVPKAPQQVAAVQTPGPPAAPSA